nr:3-ketoacyl-CoA synthase 11-like [Ipomoea batatas]
MSTSMREKKMSETTRSSRKLPDFKQSVKLKYVKLGYHYLITHGMYILVPLFLSPLLLPFAAHLSKLSLEDLYALSDHHLRSNLASLTICSTLLVFLCTLYFLTRPRPVYLVNFSCYKPGNGNMCSREGFMVRTQRIGTFTDENIEFQRKITERSGISDFTYLPDALNRIPANPCLAEARKEAEMVMFGAIDEVLDKSCVEPKDIGILVVNCSLFNPTPSLSARIVNHYKLGGNVLSYNLDPAEEKNPWMDEIHNFPVQIPG